MVPHTNQKKNVPTKQNGNDGLLKINFKNKKKTLKTKEQ